MALALVGQILTDDGFTLGRVTIEGERIRAVEIRSNFDTSDADYFLPDHYIGPGMIELQLNGGLGDDFTAEPAAAQKVADYLLTKGVTGYLPTIITESHDVLLHAIESIAEVMAAQTHGARILGTHLEGPYIDHAHRGIHNAAHVRPPSMPEMREFFAAARGTLKIVTLAPELPGAHELIRFLRQQGIVVSAGHTGATYEEANAAFDAGIGWVTHLFNAQPPIRHRSPGFVGAALERPGLVIGIIVDGFHVHPSVCDLVYRSKGMNITLVTDALAALGLGPGNYTIGGRDIRVDDTLARSANSETIAGSVLTLDRAVTNMMAFAQVPRHDAWRMASSVPAQLLGLHEKGEVRPDFVADILVMSPQMQPVLTVLGGQVVYHALEKV